MHLLAEEPASQPIPAPSASPPALIKDFRSKGTSFVVIVVLASGDAPPDSRPTKNGPDCGFPEEGDCGCGGKLALGGVIAPGDANYVPSHQPLELRARPSPGQLG